MSASERSGYNAANVLQDLPVLRPLAGFSKPMQIAWLGRVHAIGRFGQRRPQIEVVLRAPDGSDATARRLVPAAFVRALRIGDVWHGPNLVGVSSAPLVHLDQIQISGKADSVRPIGMPLPGSSRRYALDFKSFADHSEHTGSFAVFEELGDGCWMVVPCWELLRFYFGASGSLAVRLLSGPLAARMLYESVRHDVDKDIHWLDLAAGIHATAAATVARIALSQRAASAARWIANSGTAATVNGERYYPKTNFPFSGPTDLCVHARWLPGIPQVLFVERIVSCSHPFPFRTLHYSTRISVPTWSITRTRPNSVENKTGTGAPRPQLTEGAIARDGGVRIVHLPPESIPAFPDLVGKNFRRVKPKDAIARGRASAPCEPPVLVDGSDTADESFPSVEVTSNTDGDHEFVAPEAIEVLAQSVRLLQAEGFRVDLRNVVGREQEARLVPLKELLSRAPAIARDYSVVGLRRAGASPPAALCMIRTAQTEAHSDTHLLLMRRRGDDPSSALYEGVRLLETGFTQSRGILAAPEAVAGNPVQVARLIRRLYS